MAAEFNSGDGLRSTLAQIPTVFGRLVYLASLRNRDSGHYEHAALERIEGPEEAARTLRRLHREVFAEWLNSSLERQKNDLEEFAAGLDMSQGRAPAGREPMELYRDLMPPSVREVERLLYLTDLETLLELLSPERPANSGPQ